MHKQSPGHLVLKINMTWRTKCFHKNIQFSPDINIRNTGRTWPNYWCDSQDLCLNLLPMNNLFQWTSIKRKCPLDSCHSERHHTHVHVCQIITISKGPFPCPSSHSIPPVPSFFFSEPGVPSRVHATQIVQAVCCSHQGVDLTLSTLKLSQVMKAGHDGCDGLLDQWH